MRRCFARLITLAVFVCVFLVSERLHGQSTPTIIQLSGGPVNIGTSTRLQENGGDSLVIDFSGVTGILSLGSPTVTLVVNGQALPCTSPVINGPMQMQCDTPAGTPGAQATVVVTFPGGASATAEVEYWAPIQAALVLRAQCAGPDPNHPLMRTVVFEYTNSEASDLLVSGPNNVLTVNGVVDPNTTPGTTFLPGTHTAFVYQYRADATVAWSVIDPLSSLTRTAAAGWWTPPCPGAPGPQGPAGPQGPQGPAGLMGPAGPAGAAGADGADGAVGPQGLAGADGAVGPQGPAGPPGADGAVGPQGPSGPTGLTGASGADGAAGPQGPAGTNGADGAIGLQGPAGAAGAVGPQGPAGVGLAGPTGPAGPQGPAGGAADLVSGSLLMLPEGVAPPANYSRVGSFTQDVDTGPSGNQKKLKLTIVIFRKQ